MMQNPAEFYQKELAKNETLLKEIKKRLFALGMLRLVLFFIAGFGVYWFLDTPLVAALFGIVGLAAFLFTVSKNTDVRHQKKHIEHLIGLNQLELRLLKHDITDLDTGLQYVSENHHYNQDIDLFGTGSIFQYINRTSTLNGERYLASVLNSNATDEVLEKQAAIRHLADKPHWRQEFQTVAALIPTKVENTTVLNWLSGYKAVIPAVFKFIPTLFSVLSVGTMVAYGLGWITLGFLLVWFFTGLAISAFFIGKVNKLYLSAGKMTNLFTQYAKLLKAIEKEEFEPGLLARMQDKIKTDKQKASVILKELSGLLNSLDQRNNILFAFVANGFFLWDLRYAYRVEKWLADHSGVAGNWFETIEFFDAYNSLANYAFNYPANVYPVCETEGERLVHAEELGHPLLDENQRVTNNFSIDEEGFIIITGANMAGKSTFLRTIALNLVMANIGLPVCAKGFVYKPIKLISSMRTSDSLHKDESYFFSELKRLKFIIDEIKTDRYFVILDEILKGTNSKDKAEGSKKFVEKLVGTESTGIIATHDLSLCELEETFPEIHNHYFDAEIVNDELFFDYRFKAGVCKNMNASFLLRKMEIV